MLMRKILLKFSKILLEISFAYLSKTYNIFLNKMLQSYCYTQLCNYRKVFVFEPVSNQLHIFACCSLSFTRSLNASNLEIDG